MVLKGHEEVVTWRGRSVADPHGDRIGICEQIYADEDTAIPEWLTITLQSGQRGFVPLVGAMSRDGIVQVAFDRAAVNASPTFGDVDKLQPQQEITLYEHYGVPYSRDESSSVLPSTQSAPPAAQPSVTAQSPAAAKPPVAAPPPSSAPPPAATPPAAPTPPAVAAAPSPSRLRRVDFDTPSGQAGGDVAAPPATPPPVAIPPAASPPPTSTAPARPASPSTVPPVLPAPFVTKGPAVAPGLLVALGTGVTVYAAIRALRRRRATPQQRVSQQLRTLSAMTGPSSRAKARRQLLAMSKTAERSTRAQARLGVRAAERAKISAGQAVTHAIQAGSTASDELVSASAARRKRVVKAAARTRRTHAGGLSGRRGPRPRTRGGLTRQVADWSATVSRNSRRRARRTSAEAREIAHTAWALPVEHTQGALVSVAVRTTRGGRRARRSYRRLTRRIALGVGLATGYVAGAHGGQERYQQIVDAAARASQRPEVERLRKRLMTSLGLRTD